MMKSRLLSALLFCCAALSASADDGKVNVLYVDGTSHVVQLAQVAKLQVADGNAVMTDKDGKTVASHKISDIEKIELTASTSSIAQAKGNGGITLRSSGSTVSAEGLADGKSLEIYSAAGELVGKAVAKGGKAELSVEQLAGGVYVVKAGQQSIKMVKR